MATRRAIGLLALAAATAATAVAGTGCGASATLDPVAQAAQATTHTGGAHLAVSIQVSASNLAAPVMLDGHGFFNYASKEGSLSLSSKSLPAGALSPSQAGPFQLEELFKASSVYIASPALANRLPGGARWIKVDLARLARGAGLNLQQLAAGQSNPADALKLLSALGSAPQAVAAEQVRGVPTTRYRATVSLARVLQALGGGSAQLAGAVRQLTAQAAPGIPVEAWVDADHLVRRLTVSLALPGAPGSPTVAISLELFDFGPTPPLRLPAQGEVFDATQTVVAGL